MIYKFKYMKSSLYILTLVLISLTNSISAQSSVWTVKGKNSTMYLGGTIHVLREQDYPLPIEFDKAFSLADELVFETDMEKINEPEFGAKLLGKITYPEGKTLKTELSKEAYLKLENALKGINIPIANLEKFKPVMATITLTLMGLKKLEVKEDGVDQHFRNLGKLHNKEVGILESVDDQLKLLANMGAGRESEFVLSSLKDYENIESGFLEMISSWKIGNLSTFEKLIKDMKKDYPAMYKSMLVDRNNNWLPKIEQHLSTKPTEFVMVGNLHLHGKDGLLNLLKSKGYKISQLEVSKKEEKKLIKQREQNFQSMGKDSVQTWTPIDGSKFGFEAISPEKMVQSNQTVQSEVGELTMNMFTYTPKSKDDNLVYMIINSQYPEGSVNSDNIEQRSDFFTGAINGAVKNVNGKLLTEKSLKLGDYPGKEVTIDYNNGVYIITLRVYLVKNQVYMMQVISETSKSGNSDSVRFLESLKLK